MIVNNIRMWWNPIIEIHFAVSPARPVSIMQTNVIEEGAYQTLL
jgi:hypothetical protein